MSGFGFLCKQNIATRIRARRRRERIAKLYDRRFDKIPNAAVSI